jgi:hypothetical protein
MAINEIVDVIPVRDSFMAAVRAMDMVFSVAGAVMGRRTDIWILFRNLETMLIHVIPVIVMEMTVVKVVDMVFMLNGRVSTIRAMNMCMVRVMVAWFV